jgi:uncharacterized protein
MAVDPLTPSVHHRRHAWKRRIVSVSRWLHIYLSMVSFAILLFFAVTGLTANHNEWFAARQRVQQRTGTLDVKRTRPLDAGDASRLEIVESLRRVAGVRGALGDFRVDDSQLSVSFKGPGYAADAVIDRDTGRYDLTETLMGLGALVNDLHKGRDTGDAWKALIDVAAVLMTCVALSGIALIFFMQRWRVSGLASLGVGGLLGYLIYVLWVP